MPTDGIPQRLRLTLLSLLVMTSSLLSQPLPHSPFGPILEFPLGNNVSGLLSGDFNGDRRADLGAFGSSQVTILYAAASGRYVQKDIRVAGRIGKVVAVDCNRDRMSDLVMLEVEPPRVAVYLSRRDTFRLGWVKELSFAADEILMGDVNNDRKTDIILYGKKILGVYVLYGRGNGVFGSPQAFLEEYSFAKIVVYDFNADGFADILAYNWVNNELLLFSGLGQMRFTIPASIFLPSEMVDVALSFVNADNTVDLLVAFQGRKEVRAFFGDGLGNFTEEITAGLPFVPSKILLWEGDGMPQSDLLIFSEDDRSFATYSSRGLNEFFTQPIVYGAGVKPVDMTLIHSLRDGRDLVAILDRGARTLLLYPAHGHSVQPEKGQLYVLGSRPQGMHAFDVNRDGFPDLLVSNSGSDYFSLYLNRTDGTFSSLIPIGVEPFGESIQAQWKNDTTLLCVVTHPTADKLSFTELDVRSLSRRGLSVSTVPSPEIISLARGSAPGEFSLIVTGRDPADNSVSLVHIRYLDAQQVIEKPVVFSADEFLIGAEVCDIDRDGTQDLVYAVTEKPNGTMHLAVALGAGSAEFRKARKSFPLPDTGIHDMRIWCSDINADTLPDVIAQFRSNTGSYLAYGYAKDDSGFTALQEHFSPVAVRKRGDLVVVDIDNDGYEDIVVANAITKMIEVFPTRKLGKEFRPKRLLSLPAGGAFVIEDFNNDGTPDLAVAYAEAGYMRVFLGKR